MQRYKIEEEETFEKYEQRLADCDELVAINHYGNRIIICVDNNAIKGIYLEDDIKKQIVYSHNSYIYYKRKPRNLDEIQ